MFWYFGSENPSITRARVNASSLSAYHARLRSAARSKIPPVGMVSQVVVTCYAVRFSGLRGRWSVSETVEFA